MAHQEEVKVKTFDELREAKVTAKFTDHTPDKDFNDLAKKNRVKVTHDNGSETTTIHGDEKGVLSVLKTMYGNDWKYMYTKKGSTYVGESVKLDEAVSKVKTTMPDKVASSATRFGLKAKSQGGSVSISGPKGKLHDFLRAIIGRSSYGDASELTEETYAPEVQTKYGVVHVSKRDTKGMRGKQDGFKLTLKTKSGKTVDLGSHPRPNDANIKSVAKSVMESVESLDEAKVNISFPQATGQSIPQFEKMSKELLKKKHLGIEFEKAAAFARVMFMNSSLSVQDKAMKGLLTLIKGIDDLTVKTTLIKILKDNGFKVKGGRVSVSGRVMREEVEPIAENYRTLATHGMGAETKNSINVGRDVDYYEPKNGDKRMGKITKMTRSGYVVKDEKDGKSYAFAFHDRAKAKEILAKSK